MIYYRKDNKYIRIDEVNKEIIIIESTDDLKRSIKSNGDKHYNDFIYKLQLSPLMESSANEFDNKLIELKNTL